MEIRFLQHVQFSCVALLFIVMFVEEEKNAKGGTLLLLTVLSWSGFTGVKETDLQSLDNYEFQE